MNILHVGNTVICSGTMPAIQQSKNPHVARAVISLPNIPYYKFPTDLGVSVTFYQLNGVGSMAYVYSIKVIKLGANGTQILLQAQNINQIGQPLPKRYLCTFVIAGKVF